MINADNHVSNFGAFLKEIIIAFFQGCFFNTVFTKQWIESVILTHASFSKHSRIFFFYGTVNVSKGL